ncbi:MAG: HXXEE domain-containing protein [Promethearchaeota archaeon]
MNLKSFNKIWPRIGGVFATIITIIVMVLWNKYYPGSVIFLLFWLNLAVLMYHEFEEYVLPGGFRHFINYKTVLGVSEPGDKEPISDMVIIVINLGIWVIFIIAALLAKIAPWLGVGMLLFNVVNILGHLIIFQKKVKGYNPGMITAILMIPYLIFALKIVIDQNILSTGEYILAAIVGIVSGISLPISGVIIRKRTLK